MRPDPIKSDRVGLERLRKTADSGAGLLLRGRGISSGGAAGREAGVGRPAAPRFVENPPRGIERLLLGRGGRVAPRAVEKRERRGEERSEDTRELEGTEILTRSTGGRSSPAGGRSPWPLAAPVVRAPPAPAAARDCAPRPSSGSSPPWTGSLRARRDENIRRTRKREGVCVCVWAHLS